MLIVIPILQMRNLMLREVRWLRRSFSPEVLEQDRNSAIAFSATPPCHLAIVCAHSVAGLPSFLPFSPSFFFVFINICSGLVQVPVAGRHKDA